MVGKQLTFIYCGVFIDPFKFGNWMLTTMYMYMYMHTVEILVDFNLVIKRNTVTF